MSVIPLREARDLGPQRVGAKAARLSALGELGLPVLPGCVLAPEPLSAWLTVGERPQGLLEGKQDPQARRAERLAFQRARESAGWRIDPAEVASECLTAVGPAPMGLVVRSSARFEDGARHSWAGIFDSLFCAAEPDALAGAIVAVWASQFSYAAALYARRTGLRPPQDAMAVLVQPALVPRCGGVAFSRSPLEPESGHRLVEAAWGLPKAVVDGASAADRYTLAPGGALLRAQLADKDTRLDLEAGVLVPRPVADALRREPCLNRAELARLEQALQELERSFAGPQDMEWAWTDAGMILLQARPQTSALPPS